MSWLLFFKEGALLKLPVSNFDPADLARVGLARGWEGALLLDHEPTLTLDADDRPVPFNPEPKEN